MPQESHPVPKVDFASELDANAVSSHSQSVEPEGRGRFLSHDGLLPNTAGANCKCEFLHAWK